MLLVLKFITPANQMHSEVKMSFFQLPIATIHLFNVLVEEDVDWLPIVKAHSVFPVLVSLLMKSLKVSIFIYMHSCLLIFMLSFSSLLFSDQDIILLAYAYFVCICDVYWYKYEDQYISFYSLAMKKQLLSAQTFFIKNSNCYVINWSTYSL